MTALDEEARIDELVDVDLHLKCLAGKCARVPIWYATPPCGCSGPMCDNHKIDREAAARRGSPMTCGLCHGYFPPPVVIRWRPL